jgi:plasmid stabilization system protein ParE
MKKLVFIVLLMFSMISLLQASKLSRYVHKSGERARAAEARQWREDMDFADLDFRLIRRVVEDNGQRCRLYSFRSHKNPYKHGEYKVCS